MQLTKTGDAVYVRPPPVDLDTDSGALGYESAGERACGSLECRQGRGKVCDAGCGLRSAQAEMSAAFKDSQDADLDAPRQPDIPWGDIVGWPIAAILVAGLVHLLTRVIG